MNLLLCSVKHALPAALLMTGLTFTVAAHADDAASRRVPTKHQMMKECMAKQKASDSGMPKEQMKKTCRDVTETAQENAKADKKSSDRLAGPPP